MVPRGILKPQERFLAKNVGVGWIWNKNEGEREFKGGISSAKILPYFQLAFKTLIQF